MAANTSSSVQLPIFVHSAMTTRVLMPMNTVSRQIKNQLEKVLQKNFEGKCIAEGYIRPNSIRIISYSAGIIKNGNIEFTILYEADVCHPVENLLLECEVKTVTNAGIHAAVKYEKDNIEPITVFVLRDHHYTNKYFSMIEEKQKKSPQKITVRVVNVKYELNDTCVYVIGELKRTPTVGGALSDESENEFVGGGDDDDDDEEDENDDEDDD